MRALHTTVAPEPGTLPDLVPGTLDPAADTALVAAVDAVFEVRIGCQFPDQVTDHVYTYSAPMPVGVGSLVVVPPSWFRPQPTIATVVTLDPPPYSGEVKRVLAVLS